MSEEKHGRRYSTFKKKEILKFLEKHTYKETNDMYDVSEPTLSRWKKWLKKEKEKEKMKKNTQITISLPQFWLNYLNDQIAAKIWLNYSDAMLDAIRYYFKSQKSIQRTDPKYLDNIERVIKLVSRNPDINSVLLTDSNEIIYKNNQWESIEGVHDFISDWQNIPKTWKPGHRWHITGVPELIFQGNEYHIRDISVKHLMCAPKGHTNGFLMGLKRKLDSGDIFILVKTINNDLKTSMLVVMDGLKKIAMGLPASYLVESREITAGIPTSYNYEEMPISELKNVLEARKEYVDKSQDIMSEYRGVVWGAPEGAGKTREELTELLNSRLREKYGDDIVDDYPFIKHIKNKLRTPPLPPSSSLHPASPISLRRKIAMEFQEFLKGNKLVTPDEQEVLEREKEKSKRIEELKLVEKVMKKGLR